MSELAHLLDALERFVRRFVVVDESQATAVVLWIAHTWAIDAAYATPYLFVTSAEPESGKTRLLEVVRELVREPLSTMNISDAALFRAIDAKSPTTLYDEVDAIFSAKARDREDLRALLNSGYRRGELVYRMGGANKTTLESFAVFGAKALAGLGDLPPTLASRCIRIEVKRRRRDEPVEDFFPEEVGEEADRLQAWLGSWAGMAIETLRAARPARVDGLRDRTNEVWRPLLAIAELAGGDWPARSRRAALSLAAEDAEDVSLGILLLGDIRTIFDEQEAERIATADLIGALAAFEESPWGEWWLDPKTEEPAKAAPRKLASFLHPYGVRPTTVRVGEKTPRGYRQEDFLDAWERLLPRHDTPKVQHPQHPSNHAGLSTLLEVQQSLRVVDSEGAPNPHESSDVALVADLAVQDASGGAVADSETTAEGAILEEVAELVAAGVLVPFEAPDFGSDFLDNAEQPEQGAEADEIGRPHEIFLQAQADAAEAELEAAEQAESQLGLEEGE